MSNQEARNQSDFTDKDKARLQDFGGGAPEIFHPFIVEAAQEGIWILDAQYHTTYANTNMAALLGTTPEAMQKSSLFDFLFPEDERIALSLNNADPAQINTPFECRYRQSDGSARHVRVTACQVRDQNGNLAGIVAMHTGLPAKENPRDAVEASHKEMDLMIDSVKDYAILAVDENRRVLTWNSGAHVMFGFTEEEMVGQLTDKIFTEEDIAANAPETELDTAKRIGHSYDDRWHVRKDGTRFFASGVMTRLSEDGESTKFIKICRDLTEKKNLEDIMMKADRHKNEFLATLAHELRNPLASILSGIEVLKEEREYVKTKMTREIIERQVQQMIHLVNDLLDISRISLGKIKINKVPINLIDAIHLALETARPIIDGYRHAFTISLPAGPIIVDGDITRLSQVFMNILINSAKYTPPLGNIKLQVMRKNGEVEIRIRDNGIGIPPKMLSSIFQMFEQIQDRSEYPQAGLGIGLSVVKQLVEMHGGVVEAHSEGINRGSEFIVKLPVVAHPSRNLPIQESVNAGGAQQVETAPARKKILLVDDNTDAADMMELLLKKNGFVIRKVYNGETAIRQSLDFNPDIVLLDLGLPDINGYDVLKALQQQPGNRYYIALSGWGQEEDLVRSKEAGFDHHLVKPIDIQTLHEILASLA